ncbi:glycosyltransferase family 1 protein [Agromyces sp. Marseille-P2726]|uniref:glycosyltransferase family 1 protein n=1 Tax=Agromyces sp. Marseille-P2726 TaxID=2709132 RepID=UPI00157090CB|nr:glycosyltransferase family 1 protein [Agromyces sp. Marseille-P2726]
MSGRPAASTTRPRVLVLCFDDISTDPRVIRQVRRLVSDFDVTTCSPGPQPHPQVEHVELDPSSVRPRRLIEHHLDGFAREREWFTWSYWRIPNVQLVRRLLRGRRFDAVIANDAETIGVANRMFGARRVHADLHEFFPGLPVEDSRLGHRQRRYLRWLIRRHAAKARSSTTVGAEIAKRYTEYGLNPGVVTNATHYRRLDVKPTRQPLRLVHSGNPFRERGTEETMRAVAAVPDLTLDLYLTHNNTSDREYLVELADSLGPRITVHEPVPQSELIETLNRYDVGIFVLPPTNENHVLALPNKFFDYVQARLAVVVGPTLEMARLTRDRGLGVVTETFDEPAIVAALSSLTVEQVDAFKRASDAAAEALSSENQVEVWAAAVDAIVANRRSLADALA